MDIGAETIDFFLARGWQVFAIDLPISGRNSSEYAQFAHGHFDFWKLEDGMTSPVAKFMLPIKKVVDLIESEAAPNRTILMIGRSGGGWATYTYAALGSANQYCCIDRGRETDVPADGRSLGSS